MTDQRLDGDGLRLTEQEARCYLEWGLLKGAPRIGRVGSQYEGHDRLEREIAGLAAQ